MLNEVGLDVFDPPEGEVLDDVDRTTQALPPALPRGQVTCPDEEWREAARDGRSGSAGLP